MSIKRLKPQDRRAKARYVLARTDHEILKAAEALLERDPATPPEMRAIIAARRDARAVVKAKAYDAKKALRAERPE